MHLLHHIHIILILIIVNIASPIIVLNNAPYLLHDPLIGYVFLLISLQIQLSLLYITHLKLSIILMKTYLTISYFWAPWYFRICNSLLDYQFLFTMKLGGPSFKVRTGRRDTRTFSLAAADAQLLDPDTDITTFLNYMAGYDINTAQAVAILGLSLS